VNPLSFNAWQKASSPKLLPSPLWMAAENDRFHAGSKL
jgi:hypothetical protein